MIPSSLVTLTCLIHDSHSSNTSLPSSTSAIFCILDYIYTDIMHLYQKITSKILIYLISVQCICITKCKNRLIVCSMFFFFFFIVSCYLVRLDISVRCCKVDKGLLNKALCYLKTKCRLVSFQSPQEFLFTIRSPLPLYMTS